MQKIPTSKLEATKEAVDATDALFEGKVSETVQRMQTDEVEPVSKASGISSAEIRIRQKKVSQDASIGNMIDDFYRKTLTEIRNKGFKDPVIAHSQFLTLCKESDNRTHPMFRSFPRLTQQEVAELVELLKR